MTDFSTALVKLKSNEVACISLWLDAKQFDNLTDTEKNAFCEALKNNNTLYLLDVRRNIFDEKFAEKIIASLKVNTTLTSFFYNKELVLGKSVKAISDLLERNRKSVLEMPVTPEKKSLDGPQFETEETRLTQAAQAARTGDVNLLHTLVNHYPELMKQIIFNRSLLHFAGEYGHVNCVKVLLQSGANVNLAGTEEIGTALHLTVSSHNTSIVAAELLLKAGADVSLTAQGKTPLHYVQTVEMAKLLIDYHADKNAVDNEVGCQGNTILHSALENKVDNELFSYLLNQGLDINATNAGGKTALHALVWYQEDINLTQLNMLLKAGADPFIKDKKNNTPLDVVKNLKRHESAEILKKAIRDYLSIKQTSWLMAQATRSDNSPLFFDVPAEIGSHIAKFAVTSDVLNEETRLKLSKSY